MSRLLRRPRAVRLLAVVCVVTLFAAVTSASALAARPSISARAWGTVGGHAVDLYTLRSGHGMTVRITNYGGTVQSIIVRTRSGRTVHVALGFRSLADYVHDRATASRSRPSITRTPRITSARRAGRRWSSTPARRSPRRPRTGSVSRARGCGGRSTSADGGVPGSPGGSFPAPAPAGRCREAP